MNTNGVLTIVLTWSALFATAAPAAEKAKPAPKPAAPKPPLRAEDLLRDRGDGIDRIPLLPPGPGNPRNSEGALLTLADGRLMLVYTHSTGGGGDHSAAHLAARFSSDHGKTWMRDDVIVVPNEGRWNGMSVSLLRLADGRIASFYLRKESANDCRPIVRFSSDEGKTWSEPRVCIEDQVGYYVLNNDRAVQLRSGTADPTHFDPIDPFMPAQPKMKSRPVVALLPAAAMHFIALNEVPRDDPHLGADAGAIGRHAHRFHLKPVMGDRRFVLQDRRLAAERQ